MFCIKMTPKHSSTTGGPAYYMNKIVHERSYSTTSGWWMFAGTQEACSKKIAKFVKTHPMGDKYTFDIEPVPANVLEQIKSNEEYKRSQALRTTVSVVMSEDESAIVVMSMAKKKSLPSTAFFKAMERAGLTVHTTNTGHSYVKISTK